MNDIWIAVLAVTVINVRFSLKMSHFIVFMHFYLDFVRFGRVDSARSPMLYTTLI